MQVHGLDTGRCQYKKEIGDDVDENAKEVACGKGFSVGRNWILHPFHLKVHVLAAWSMMTLTHWCQG